MTEKNTTVVSKDTSTAAPSEPQKSAPQSANEQPTELTISDLNALKQIIDVASQRGAFKPNEMVTVGSTYTKLETFLTAVSQQQPAPEKGE